MIAFPTAMPRPWRSGLVCGEARADCEALAREVWGQIRDAAQAASDRTAACRFSAFPAYEYTAMPYASNLHRHVVFRNSVLPSLPVSYVEAPEPHQLWELLEQQCLEGLPGCDVIAIPHNANQSNGKKFAPGTPGTMSDDDQRRHATRRARIEPLVEIFQHKGDSECMNGLEGVVPDPLCDFEKTRKPPFHECRKGWLAVGGALRRGCVSKLDYVRGALVEGLREDARIGVTPQPLGFVASQASRSPKLFSRWGKYT